MQCNTVESNLTTFQLRADVVEELKAKYVEWPLTFPVNFFNINRFAGIPTMATLSHVLSSTVNNCDTLFLLVPNTPNS
jgi:bacteriorhodopsin